MRRLKKATKKITKRKTSTKNVRRHPLRNPLDLSDDIINAFRKLDKEVNKLQRPFEPTPANISQLLLETRHQLSELKRWSRIDSLSRGRYI